MGNEYSKRVWQQKELKGGKLLVMLALSDHANATGECWPGMPLLMEKTRLTDRQIRRVLNSLATDGYISIEERAIGRGKRPHYTLFPAEKVDITPEEKRTFCPSLEEKADICDIEKRTFATGKADICDTIQSHARREPITEPTTEERARARTHLPVLPSRDGGDSARDKITFKSPHVDKSHFDLDTGYIAAGQGVTAVEVYYERFDVQQNKARLNAIKEDDLVRHCPDLERLREVVTAYSQTSYQPGNLKLILDWYREGIPQKHRAASAPQRRSNSELFLNYAAENGVFYGRA